MTTSLDHRFNHTAEMLHGEAGSSAEEAAPEPEKGELLINPRYHFHRPMAVLRADALDRREKIDVLQGWAEDLLEESQPVSRTFQTDPAYSRKELEEIRSVLEELGRRQLKAA